MAADIEGQRVVRAQPDEGDSIGFDTEVLDVAVTEGRLIWTVGPSAETCEVNDSLYGAGNWDWSTWDDEVWEVVYRRRVYAIKASPLGGVKSIAGFRVSPRTRRSMPTVRRVMRAFGRPASLRRGPGKTACTARWRRLGLTVVFVNFGLSPPCRLGYLQAATIAGPRARHWAAVIGGRPGVTSGTSLEFLEQEGVGGEDPFGRRLWTISEVWTPYGRAGYIPAVSAFFSGRGRLLGTDVVRGFELWVGAGGD